MQHHLLWVVFVAYFTFLNKCEARQPEAENDVPYILAQLLENKNKPPLILYLEPKQRVKSATENSGDLRDITYFYDDDREDDSDEEILKIAHDDERAYVLYHLLRTTIEQQDIDPEAVQQLEHTQNFLRNAFIGRCNNLKRCLKQCPEPQKKFYCTVQCKQAFDDLDECDLPKKKKCGKPKCGNTMPPSWLL